MRLDQPPLVAVDDQVEVRARAAEQRVAHGAADQVRLDTRARAAASRTAAKPGQGGDPVAEAVGGYLALRGHESGPGSP